MSMRIPPSPLPAPTRMASWPASGEVGAPRFRALIREFEGGGAGPTDFLGQQQAAGGSASLFNADGFFTKLEQRLSERPAEQSAGQPAAMAAVPAVSPIGAGKGEAQPNAGPFEPETDRLPAVGQKLAQHLPDRQSRPELPSQASGQARAHRPAPVPAGPPADNSDVPMASGDEGPGKSEHAHQPPVRLELGSTPFRVFIDGASVRIIGPARYLSEAEGEALAAAVADLMTTHDLGLEDLWFNGQRMMPGQGGAA